MLKVPLLKAALSRWASTSTLLSIGKWIPLLIAPVAVLYGYGQVQASERKIAERRVDQLTSDVIILSRSLAQAEQYAAGENKRIIDHASRLQVLSHDTSDVLDLPAPADIVDIMRIVQSAGNH